MATASPTLAQSGPGGADLDPSPGTHDDDLDPVAGDPPAPSEAVAPAQNVMDVLRSKRKAILANRTTTFEIPGYSGRLHARYRILDFDEMRKIASRVDASKHPRKDLLGVCDTIIESCVEMLWSESGDGNDLAGLASLTGDDLSAPIRFDSRLAKLLDVEVDGARSTVMRVFENEIAATAHHNEITKWMQGERKEVDDEFEGE